MTPLDHFPHRPGGRGRPLAGQVLGPLLCPPAGPVRIPGAFDASIHPLREVTEVFD